MGGDEAHALGVIAVGQRNAGVGGAAAGRGDPRHHLKTDAAAHQRLQLLAATVEDEGVAPFSRTTRWPFFASSSNSWLIPSCGTQWLPACLPTKMRLASRRTSAITSSETSRS